MKDYPDIASFRKLYIDEEETPVPEGWQIFMRSVKTDNDGGAYVILYKTNPEEVDEDQ